MVRRAAGSGDSPGPKRAARVERKTIEGPQRIAAGQSPASPVERTDRAVLSSKSPGLSLQNGSDFFGTLKVLTIQAVFDEKYARGADYRSNCQPRILLLTTSISDRSTSGYPSGNPAGDKDEKKGSGFIDFALEPQVAQNLHEVLAAVLRAGERARKSKEPVVPRVKEPSSDLNLATMRNMFGMLFVDNRVEVAPHSDGVKVTFAAEGRREGTASVSIFLTKQLVANAMRALDFALKDYRSSHPPLP